MDSILGTLTTHLKELLKELLILQILQKLNRDTMLENIEY